jgi:hypothetical protein
MRPAYWILKAFDVSGWVLVMWAAANNGDRLVAVAFAMLGVFIASICAELEGRWTERGWLVKDPA